MKKGFNITAYFGEVHENPEREKAFLTAFKALTKDFTHAPILMFPGGQTQAQELSQLYTAGDPFLTNPYSYVEEFAELCKQTGSHAAISFTFDYELMVRMGVRTPGSGAERINWRDNNLRLLRYLRERNVPIHLIRLGNELYMNELFVGTKFRLGAQYNPQNVLQRIANLLNRDRKSAKQLYQEAAEQYVRLCYEYVDEIRRIDRNVKIAAVVAEEENAAYRDWNDIIVSRLRNTVDYFNFQLYINGNFRNAGDIEKLLREKIGRQMNIPKVMCEYWWQFFASGFEGVDPASYELYCSSIEGILQKMGFQHAYQWRLVGQQHPGGNFNAYNKITLK